MGEKNREIAEIVKELGKLYEHLERLKVETIGALGKEEALHIIDFHGNNWIDIYRWVTAEYEEEIVRSSLLFFYYARLLKEIYWMQLLFLMCNYPAVYRDLRYVWELIFQGYFIDSRFSEENLDRRVEIARELEKKMYGWRLVNSVLKGLGFSDDGIEKYIHPLWGYLNKHAHPSPVQFEEIARADFSLFFRDTFNKEMAVSLLRKTDAVFDLINYAVLKRFPEAVDLAGEYRFLNEWKEYALLTYSLVIGDNKNYSGLPQDPRA